MVKPSGSGTGEDEEEESQWEYLNLLQFNIEKQLVMCSHSFPLTKLPQAVVINDNQWKNPMMDPRYLLCGHHPAIPQMLQRHCHPINLCHQIHPIYPSPTGIIILCTVLCIKQYSLYNMFYIICRSLLKRKRRTVAMDPLEREIVNTLSEFSKSASGMFSPQQPTNTLDEEDHFAGSVAATLRRLQPRSRAIAKFRIQDILLQLEFPQPEPSVPAPTPSTYYPNNSF